MFHFTKRGRHNIRIASLCILCFFGVFVVDLSGRHAGATENGGSNYLPGFYGDFQMAVMPKEKGFYLSQMFSAYQDPKSVTGNLLELPGIMYVTDTRIFGANYAVGVWPALQAIKDNTLANNRVRVAFGDPYFMPVSLGWDLGCMHAEVFEGVVAPIGYYEKNQPSPGGNIWTFDHNLAATFKLPAANELSFDLGYMNNTQNPATHYTNGDEIHFDYMVGHYLQQDFALGVVGSYYRQVTADQAPADILAKAFSAADTIGPVVMYAPRIGKKNVSMSLKWLHEFDVQGKLPQDYIIWRVYMPF
ncbi:MAG: transporter [Methylomonas sp.]|jgi:hypothetical protein